jgi:ATP-binding cassette subfamily B protein
VNLKGCFWFPLSAANSAFDEAAAALARAGNIEALEFEEETPAGGNLAESLRRASPAVVVLQTGDVLALERVRGSYATLLAPDGRRHRISLTGLCDALSATAAAPHQREVAAMLDSCGIQGRRRERARRALLAERLVDTVVCRIVQLRTHPAASFAGQLSQCGFWRRLVAFALAHLADYALWLLAWAAIGAAALGGRVDSGGLLAWALLLAAIVPIRLWVAWSQGVLAVTVGGLLKQRLLAGTLSLEADALRAEGAGRMLGRTLEAEALENLALAGGLAALLSALELSVACVVLWFGSAGWRHAALLVLWIALALALGYWYIRRRARWTGARLAMTHDLVERMSGHRTRLAQEPPEEWHAGEDDAMAAYASESRRMDRIEAILTAALPRGFELVAFAVLMPFWANGTVAAEPLAIAIGGVLLAGQSLRRLTAGLAQLAAAGIAWRQVAPLFRFERPPQSHDLAPRHPSRGDTVLDAADLTFRYRREGAPILQGCSLQIRRGDFVLLEGGSGSGKSTLGSLIAGLRRPESGMLLAGGLDLHSLGDAGWRKRVAAAPQYHENHVLAAPFSFNLLMGRAWPPTESDLREAETICRELGLGPLLERMPGGLMQMVGETGWQLSQGERSRLFLARALLQGADLTILDESFAALDPESLRLAMECVFRRAQSLLAIAHP